MLENNPLLLITRRIAAINPMEIANSASFPVFDRGASAGEWGRI
ncbi:hypothetical protein [Emcibacter sp. SYSU 3D8]